MCPSGSLKCRNYHIILFTSGGVELGPVEVEIVDLEKQLTATKEEVNRLQAEWLKRQDDLVRLTNQRDSVLHQSELLRKEVFIMERKRQRLDSEVEAKKAEITKVRKNTETIRAEIATVNAKLHEDRYMPSMVMELSPQHIRTNCYKYNYA